MKAPISVEFGRVFEENNLGIPIVDAMDNMTDRVPNLDLKFFATAVILQRQTGGDLAEILDKIGHLIRERFKIWGQVQALTGETASTATPNDGANAYGPYCDYLSDKSGLFMSINSFSPDDMASYSESVMAQGRAVALPGVGDYVDGTRCGTPRASA